MGKFGGGQLKFGFFPIKRYHMIFIATKGQLPASRRKEVFLTKSRFDRQILLLNITLTKSLGHTNVFFWFEIVESLHKLA